MYMYMVWASLKELVHDFHSSGDQKFEYATCKNNNNKYQLILMNK